jgi:hypothetical protein
MEPPVSVDASLTPPPIVIARQNDGQISCPFLMERRPGELWITAGFAAVPLRLKVKEEPFLPETKNTPRSIASALLATGLGMSVAMSVASAYRAGVS